MQTGMAIILTLLIAKESDFYPLSVDEHKKGITVCYSHACLHLDLSYRIYVALDM